MRRREASSKKKNAMSARKLGKEENMYYIYVITLVKKND
jgi:hypothetical protein